MSFWKRLFGGESSPATDRRPIPSRQVALTKPGTWPDGFRFSFAKGKGGHRDLIVETVNQSAADKVLVVGGIGSFESGDSALFAGRRVFLNKRCRLSELCEACRSIRQSRERAVVVTNFPSEVDPPRASWVEMPAGIERTWSAPPGTNLEIAGERDTIAVIFGHLSNTSYYEKVLRAQGWPAREILECAILSDGDGLIEDHKIELRAGASEQRVRKLLIKGSETMEYFAKKEGRGDEAGILSEPVPEGVKRLVEFKTMDNLIFPLIDNVCKPRKLSHEEVSSFFIATCEKCGGQLDGYSLAIEAAAVVMGHVPGGCPQCGHSRFLAEVSGLTALEEEGLRNDGFFSTLPTPKRGG